MQSQDVISRLNEEFDRMSTSDKWWFDNCERSVELGEQLYPVVCSAKNGHNSLGKGDKMGETLRWKRVFLIELQDVASGNLDFNSSEKLKINKFLWLL